MNTENKETKLNMMNYAAMKLPNMIWEYEGFKEAPAPGSVTSAYIKARQEEAKRRPTPEELRIGGPNSEGANASDARAGSQRAGGPVSEGADAKVYEPGDMPPNGGAGFSDEPEERMKAEGRRMKIEQVKTEPKILPIQQEATEKTEEEPKKAARQANEQPLPASEFQVLQSEWIELSPYGDFGHPRGIQRVDRDAAERIVAQFNSFWAKLGRRFAGVPVYIGHPDVPEYANEYTDKKAYGWITELQARGSGLFAKVKWSQQGREFLQNAHYKFYSPYWEAVLVGEKDGKKIYRPSNLLSVGLTNQPNLPVPPLANSVERWKEEGGRMNEKPRNNSPGENRDNREIVPNEGRQDLGNRNGAAGPYLPLANEVLALQTLLMQRDERIQGLHAQLENARANWGSEQARFENEISALRSTVERLENSRIEIVLDQALEEGRIAPAEREFWNTQLRRDFETRHEELKERAEVMHMRSVTGELGKMKVDLSNAATRKKVVFELLEAKRRLGMTHDEAWFALKEERPDLFAAMEGNH